jgi:hypothetical protein
MLKERKIITFWFGNSFFFGFLSRRFDRVAFRLRTRRFCRLGQFGFRLISDAFGKFFKIIFITLCQLLTSIKNIRQVAFY